MKAHVGADAESGMVHAIKASAASVNPVTEAIALLYGGEIDAFVDGGYKGAHNRPDAKEGVT